MEFESSELQALTEDFRAKAFDFGIKGETVARMSKSPERALACLEEAIRRMAGPGLAVHMFDDGDFPQPPPRKGTNLHSAITACPTCDGDRFIVYSTRPSEQSMWMKEHGLEAKGYSEQMAPCPDCNAEANTRREGFKSSTTDQVRQRLAEIRPDRGRANQGEGPETSDTS